MRQPALDRAATNVGIAGVFAAALYPLHNPDLFWHLAVGRRMAELGRPLFEEPLALVGPSGRGLPWIGFEWLSELVFYGAWSAWGFVGLVLLKAALAAAAGWAIDSALRRRGCGPALRALSLLVWAALSQKRWMLEPELFTFLGLALLWRRLEDERRWTARDQVAWAGAFALWANLHGGVVYGLGLLVLYTAGERGAWGSRAARVGLCAAAAMVTPYGPAAYAVALRLLGELGRLRAGNVEWLSPTLLPGVLIKAYYFVPLAALALLWRRARRGASVELGRLLTAALFGLWGGLSVRSIAVAATVLVPLLATLIEREWPAGGAMRTRRGALAALALAAAGFVALHLDARAILGPLQGGVRWADYPRGLAEAAARELPIGTLWAPFDWAGYPAWRFYPDRRVYAYGRLDVFHERLAAADAARAAPERWAGFLEGAGVEGSLEKPLGVRLRGIVDDRASRRLWRVSRSPFAVLYPTERWALVHWSDEGFLFARRRPGRGDWLDPTDLDYLRLSLERGWLSRRRVCGEWSEHVRLFGPSRYDRGLESLCHNDRVGYP